MFVEITPNSILLRGDVSGSGVVDYDFNEGTAVLIAEATLRYYSRKRDIHKVLIAFDGRRKSESYAKAILHVCKAWDLETALTSRPVPLPVASWLVREYKLDLAFYITGCHAPSRYCGVKLLNWDGTYITESDLAEIENVLKRESEELTELSRTVQFATPDIVLDPYPDYIEYLTASLSREIKPSGQRRVLLDFKHGAGAGYLDEALRRLGLEVRCINYESCSETEITEPTQQSEYVQHLATEHNIDVGFILDYDQDEVCVVLPERVLTCPEALSVVLPDLVEKGIQKISCSVTCYTLLKQIHVDNIEIHDVPPGARFLSEHIARGLSELGVDESCIISGKWTLIKDPSYIITLTISHLERLKQQAKKFTKANLKITFIESRVKALEALTSLKDKLAHLLREFQLEVKSGDYYICGLDHDKQLCVIVDVGYLLKIVYDSRLSELACRISQLVRE